MRYIIYHSGMTLPKVLAMRIKCRKGLISYHKFNGIMAMKKHVEFCHDALLKIFLKDEAFEVPKSPLYCEPSKKRANVSPSNIFGFLLIALSSKKMTQHNQVCGGSHVVCLLKGCCQ